MAVSIILPVFMKSVASNSQDSLVTDSMWMSLVMS